MKDAGSRGGDPAGVWIHCIIMMHLNSALARSGLFTLLGATTVLLGPILLNLHAFLDPDVESTISLAIEVGLWIVSATLLLGILFRYMSLRSFLCTVVFILLSASAIGASTGGFELLYLLYIDGSYVPRYYVPTSIAIAVLIALTWEMIYRLKTSAILFVSGLTVITALAVGLLGYFLIYRGPDGPL